MKFLTNGHRYLIHAARCGLLLVIVLLTVHAEEPVHIWVEGQTAAESDVTRHGWYSGLDRDQLSAGGCITHYDGKKAGLAHYDVEVPQAGAYRFWVRANPTASKMQYRIADGEWQELDMSQASGRINIAADGKTDHRHIAWTDAGSVTLAAGKQRLSFRFKGGTQNSGILDCFLLTTDAIWMPRGTARPGGRAESAGSGDYIWVEGHQAVERDVTVHNWYNRLDREQLSAEGWVSHYNGKKPGTVRYDVKIEKADDYRFWVRANPSASKMQYKIGDSDWQELDMSNSVDRINVAADGSLDHRFIAWIDAGTVKLEAGSEQLSFRFEGGTQNSGILDCFIFLPDAAWVPKGTAKPGAKSGLADEGYFAWEPPVWRPDQESVHSLRYLNEQEAGVNGFVRREGDGFVLGDGTPVRFWMVQGSGLSGAPAARQERIAQRLAAYGVNLVRAGGTGFFHDYMNGNDEGFAKKLDGYHSMVAALKAQGVYLYVNHLFWNTHSVVKLPEDVCPGFDGKGKKALALLFFSEKFQDYYLGFIKKFMTTKNPHTGLSLADDPTLAIIEVNNESSVLFHSFNPTRFVDSERALVEKKFGDWCKERYGSLEAAQKAWGPHKYPDSIGGYKKNGADDPAAGRMKLYAVGHLTSADWAVSQRNDKRASDQLQFMIEAQHAFYARMKKEMRAMGIKALVSPSNWKTADQRLLGALEHYTYTANDLVANNAYFGTPSPKGGNPRFYRIEVGDRYKDRSALGIPEQVGALQHQNYADYPYMITENCWNRPNRYRAEFPLLVSAYASLAGIDGWVFFAGASDSWDSSMKVWGINDTTVFGQFPGAALMYRRGDVATGDVIYHEPLAFEDLYSFNGQAMRPADGIEDPLYAKMLEKVKQGEGQPSMIDPLAFYVGRVTRSVDDKAEGAVVADLAEHIDRQNKVVNSMTDELSWHYGDGYMTINTARAQGACGFLKKVGKIELQDIVIESENDYGSILVISLDGKPLTESKSILVQAATEDKTYGFTTKEGKDGYKTITRLGGYPLNVRPVAGSVTIKRGDLKQATVLDGNGVATDKEADTKAGSTLRISLPAEQLYTWVH